MRLAIPVLMGIGGGPTVLIITVLSHFILICHETMMKVSDSFCPNFVLCFRNLDIFIVVRITIAIARYGQDQSFLLCY